MPTLGGVIIDQYYPDLSELCALDSPNRPALKIDYVSVHADLDSEGNVKRDDLGRVVIGMRKHDHQFGWFTEIAKRYGSASGEVQQCRAPAHSNHE